MKIVKSIVKMSFDKSYIRNMTQKYRLAVAIAVLKEKPENLSIEQYIEELKNKIKNDCDEDLDLTICSDDFDIEDNDDIINDLNDYNECNNNEVFRQASSATYDDKVNKLNNEIEAHNVKILSTEKFDGSQKEIVCDRVINSNNIYDKRKNIANTSCSQNSQSLLKDNEINLEEVGLREGIKEHVNMDACSIAQEHHYATQTPITEQINNQNTTDPHAVTNNDITRFTNRNTAECVTNDSAMIANDNTEHIHFQNEICQESQRDANTLETFYDSQATVLYSVHGFTQNYTHVSQSQYYDQIIVNEKFLKAKNNTTSSKNDLNVEKALETFNESGNTKTMAYDLGIINKENNELSNNVTNEDKNESVNNETQQNSSERPKTCRMLNQNSMSIVETFPQYGQDYNDIDINLDSNIENENEAIDKIGNRSQRDVEMSEEEELRDNETEIVSFKVIEELNKVKSYISRRCERRVSNDGSIDSGYKSDSQRSSYRGSRVTFNDDFKRQENLNNESLQISGNWLNQSANSLFEYITQCPLLDTTQEIVQEIAQVLGQLIDKLHEEEKYPSFLEEILELVQSLLEDILHGNIGEDGLLKKDELVHRLLLLNKSVHIQKYSLEKIAIILEDIHSHLSNPEESYEITNLFEIENIPYIFHILEVLLLKYSKEKLASSQDITNSQNELKKSTIADVWKKKWNPNPKEDCIKESSAKKCVMLRCNEVLNKLVVTCMGAYSLVAFSALQCFNVLQS